MGFSCNMKTIRSWVTRNLFHWSSRRTHRSSKIFSRDTRKRSRDSLKCSNFASSASNSMKKHGRKPLRKEQDRKTRRKKRHSRRIQREKLQGLLQLPRKQARKSQTRKQLISRFQISRKSAITWNQIISRTQKIPRIPLEFSKKMTNYLIQLHLLEHPESSIEVRNIFFYSV